MRLEAAGEFDPRWRHDGFWSGTRAPLESATGLHPAAYTDPAFFADEQRLLFERAWVGIGLASEVADARVLVRSLGRRSILVVRDGGTLRGFRNSCRHRGTELYEDDTDIGTSLRCPYHRWGYGLDGSLRAAPSFTDVPRDDFDAAELSLVPVRVDTWGGLLFACLDPDTPALHEWLGDLPVRMAGYGLDDWRPHRSATVEIEANWKLIAENFQEYYHLPWIHPELAKVSRVEDHYRYQGPGMYCGQTTTPVSDAERDDWLRLPPADGLDDSDGVSGRFVSVFPNVLLSVLPNHAFVMRLDPVSPGRTRETCTWLLPPTTTDVTDGAFAPTHTFWLEVNGEDIDIVERGQRGLAGGAVPPGPLAPRFEEPLHRFHTMVADLMTRSATASLTPPTGDDGSDRSRWGAGVNPSPPAVDVG